MSTESSLSRNAQKRALRRIQKKEAKEAAVSQLLLETKRRDCSSCNTTVNVSSCNSSTVLGGGGKASRARRARNGESAVGTCADHRPSGGAPVGVLPQHEEIVMALERCETRARLRFRPSMHHRKIVPTDNHGSMEEPTRSYAETSEFFGVNSGDEWSFTEQSLRSFSSSHFPEAVAIESFASVLTLDLSRNELWDLPDDLSSLRSLQKLDISRNWFRSLPASISHFSRTLQSLHASHNMLRPSCASLKLDMLRDFPKLVFLDISCNQKCGRQSLRDLCHQYLPRVTLEITINYPPVPGSFVGSSAAERDATLLRSQLEPWSTTALRRRLVADFGDDITPPDKVPRSDVMERLLAKYAEEDGRVDVFVDGTLVAEKNRCQLLAALREWSRSAVGGNQERTSINASNYMILSSPAEFDVGSQKAAKAAAKLKLHKTIWELARLAMISVDPLFAQKYTALAVTHGFHGSPHIDKQNFGPFYGMALGDFEEGTGGIRVECSARVVATVNTKNRLGKVDGRYPHWVAPYDKDKERYSLIYYRTTGEREFVGPAIFEAPTVPL